MNIRKVAALGVILLGNRLMFADASYQETTQITGGSMVDSLKSVSFLSKSMSNMFAPMTTITMVHGNQKAVVSKDYTEITDLDRETITHIDTLHKTYSVVTFAQMRQAFANMPKQMEQAQAQMKEAQAQQAAQQPKTDLKTSFDVSAKNTGVTKEVNGLTAQEQVVTMQMHITDPNAPPTEAVNSMTYVITTDAWIAPDPPEVKEIQDFDMRMGQKLMAGVDMSAFKAKCADGPECGHGATLRRQAGICGSHGADGEGDGKAERHPRDGGDAHGRKRNRASSSAEYGASRSGGSSCEWVGFGCRPGSDRYGSPDSRRRSEQDGSLRECIGQLGAGGLPQEEGGHTATGCSSGSPGNHDQHHGGRWNADHHQRCLDGDDNAEVKLLAGNGSIDRLPGAGGI